MATSFSEEFVAAPFRAALWNQQDARLKAAATRPKARKSRFGVAVVLAALLLAAPAAFAQGCPMCRTGAEAAGPQASRAVNLGILVLLIPTLLLFLGVLFFALLRRDAEVETPARAPKQEPRVRTVLRLFWLIHPR